MKQYKYLDESNRILDIITYANIVELKSLIRAILNLDSISGSSSEICVLADLKTILGLYPSSKDLNILTEKQKRVIIEHLIYDKTQSQVAKELSITQQGVSVLLNSGLKRIKSYTEGQLKWIPWSDEDKAFLLENYNKYSIHALSQRLDKPASKVISMYHYLKNKSNKIGGT